MTKLENQVIDFHDDSKSVLRGLSKEAMPAGVRTSAVTAADALARLESDQFGLVVLTKSGATLRKFPLATAADAWLSKIAMAANGHKLEPEMRSAAESRIQAALVRHGIESEGHAKTAAHRIHAEIGVGGQTTVTDSGKPAHCALADRYPLDTQEQVKTAADYFDSYGPQFTPKERREYCWNLAKRAAELKVELSQKAAFRKYAAEGFGTEVSMEIRKRRDLLKAGSQLISTLAKIAESRHGLGPEKFAALLEAFDSQAGFDPIHGKFLRDPYAATYEEDPLKKTAGDGYRWSDEKTGLQLSGKELTKAADEKHQKIAAFFGPTVADQLKKHGSQIFESLPSDVKIVIARIAHGEV